MDGNLTRKSNVVTGKPPLFEVRHWDDFSNDLVMHDPIPEKCHEETSEYDLTNSNIVSSEREYGEEDKYYSPTRFEKWSNSGSVIKRSSPMQVYTYKVNCFRGCMCCGSIVLLGMLSRFKSFDNCLIFHVALEGINLAKPF